MAEYIIDMGNVPMNRRSAEVDAALRGTLVRCNDCLKYATYDCPRMALKNEHDRARIAENPFTRILLCVHYPDGYCAWGERREEICR